MTKEQQKKVTNDQRRIKKSHKWQKNNKKKSRMIK